MATNEAVQQLLAQLAGTLSPDANARKASEEALLKYQATPGYMPTLLQLIMEATVELPVRQAGAIALKNLVQKWWMDRAAEVTTAIRLSPDDKAFVRSKIVECLLSSPTVIRNQIAEVVKHVSVCDFPERFPDLCSQLMTQLFNTTDPNRQIAALLGLRVSLKKYEYMTDEETRAPLNEAIAAIFPHLLQIANSLQAVHTNESYEMQKLIMKIYYSALMYRMPPYIKDNQAEFAQWMTFFHSVLNNPVPTEGQPEDPDVRKELPVWKAKKWACSVCYRIFSRYGATERAEDDAVQFAKMFSATYAPKIMESCLNLLGIKKNGGWLPERLVLLTIQYVGAGVDSAGTYAALKPHLQTIMFEILFPELCFSAEDAKLWEEDPYEYVSKAFDIMEDFYCPRYAASQLLLDLVAGKKRKDNLKKLTQFIGAQLNAYMTAPMEQRNHSIKDGLLMAVGTISEKLIDKKDYKGMVEPMLVQHVFPEFTSQQGHLRARACWTVGKFSTAKFSTPDVKKNATQLMLACLNDPELPVKIQAAVALRSLISDPSVQEQIRPILPQLLDVYLKMMNEVDNEELIESLDVIIEFFEEEAVPYAGGIIQQLVTHFIRMMDDDDNDDAALVMMSCQRTIITMLHCLREKPEVIAQIEPALLPMFEKVVMDVDNIEYMEETLEILCAITFFGTGISPALWTLFPPLLEAVDEYCLDYFDGLLAPLDNYISRGTDAFLAGAAPSARYPQGVVYLDLVLKLIKKVFDESTLERDCYLAPHCKPAAKIMVSIYQNCHGRVDPCVPLLTKMVIEKFAQCRKFEGEYNTLEVLLLEVICSGLYYNVQMQLQVLAEFNCLDHVFAVLLQMVPKFIRISDKKICLLGLTTILTIPHDSLPEVLKNLLPTIITHCSKMVLEIEEIRIEEAEEEDDDDEEGDEDDDEDFDEDDDVLDAETEAAEARAIKPKVMSSLDDYDAFGAGDDDLEYEDNIESPLDDVDELVVFADTIQAYMSSHQQVYATLSATMDAESQQRLQSVLVKANAKKFAALSAGTAAGTLPAPTGL